MYGCILDSIWTLFVVRLTTFEIVHRMLQVLGNKSVRWEI